MWQEGFTPLHLAIRAGHIEISRCLLMSGAQPDTPNKVRSSSEICEIEERKTEKRESECVCVYEFFVVFFV